MPWEGVARQISIEHLPRTRTRGSSLSSVTPGSPVTQKGNPLARKGTVLSVTSIPEDDNAPTLPIPIPIDANNTLQPPSPSSSATAADVGGITQEKPTAERDLEKAPTKIEKPGDSLTTRLSKRLSRKATEKEHHDEFEVILADYPELDPHRWKSSYRWFLTGFVGLLVLNATFASSAPSNLLPSILHHFHISREVGTLTIAMFVAGYCFGPLLWGPFSERYGRRLVFIGSFIPYVGFQVGCALSKNIGSLLVFRFLGGVFASSPLTNSGGVIADIWGPDQRGVAMALFSLMPFAGPAIAPVVSGALQVTGSDWRWIFWILTIFAGVCLILIVFFLPETYIPYILHKQAKKLRKEHNDERYWTASEHPGLKESLGEILTRTVLKPFVMIAQEPMLLVLTLYMSFIYGIVYLLFTALPITFGRIHGLNALKVGLTFMALPIGGATGVMVYIFYFNRNYMKKHHAMKPKMVPPEVRLLPVMVAAPSFAIAFFWFGWTSYASISIWSPILAVVLLGFCILCIFLGIFNYLIDAYLVNAASALAINTVVRSAFGAGFPMFASQMYAKLDTPGASSLLGGLALLFTPAPFFLYKYGRRIRALSKNAMVIE